MDRRVREARAKQETGQGRRAKRAGVSFVADGKGFGSIGAKRLPAQSVSPCNKLGERHAGSRDKSFILPFQNPWLPLVVLRATRGRLTVFAFKLGLHWKG